MTFVQGYLAEVVEIAGRLDPGAIEAVAGLLADVKRQAGRVFFLGVGGSAANCSHAVNDFRKLAGLECYAPTDSVSELTARTNDEGWATVFAEWLKTSRVGPRDLVFVFSVGGGDAVANISANLVAALDLARAAGARIAGVVGRDGGHTARVADAVVIVPTVNPAHITPHTEAFHMVVSHLLVSHPLVKAHATKWESQGAGR